MNNIIKKPSAWIPIVLSIAVLAMILLVVGFSDPVQPVQPDEGTAAHIFQIWLALEVLLIGYFAIKWLPQAPKQASMILVLQILAVLAGCFPVFYLHL